jgi:hypothetical protein
MLYYEESQPFDENAYYPHLTLTMPYARAPVNGSYGLGQSAILTGALPFTPNAGLLDLLQHVGLTLASTTMASNAALGAMKAQRTITHVHVSPPGRSSLDGFR